MHTRNILLSHTISRLISIRVEMKHKDGKTLLRIIDVFIKIELETSG